MKKMKKMKKVIMGIGGIAVSMVPNSLEVDDVIEKNKSGVYNGSNKLTRFNNDSKSNYSSNPENVYFLKSSYLSDMDEYTNYVYDMFGADTETADKVVAKFNWSTLEDNTYRVDILDKDIANSEVITYPQDFKLPTVLVQIGARAFSNDVFIGSIELPSSVTTIGAYAFSNTTFNQNLTFGDSSKCEGIYEFAFLNAKFLLPNTFTLANLSNLYVIGAKAFENVVLPVGFALTSESVKLENSDAEVLEIGNWFKGATLNYDFVVPLWLEGPSVQESMGIDYKLPEGYIWNDMYGNEETDNSLVNAGYFVDVKLPAIDPNYKSYIQGLFPYDPDIAKQILYSFDWKLLDSGNWECQLRNLVGNDEYTFQNLTLPQGFEFPKGLTSIGKWSLSDVIFSGDVKFPSSLSKVCDYGFSRSVFKGKLELNPELKEIDMKILENAKFSTDDSFTLENNLSLKSIAWGGLGGFVLPRGFHLPNIFIDAPKTSVPDGGSGNWFSRSTLNIDFVVPPLWDPIGNNDYALKRMNQSTNLFSDGYIIPSGYGWRRANNDWATYTFAELEINAGWYIAKL